MANKKVKSLLHLAGRPVPSDVGHPALHSTQSLLPAGPPVRESERRQEQNRSADAACAEQRRFGDPIGTSWYSVFLSRRGTAAFGKIEIMTKSMCIRLHRS